MNIEDFIDKFAGLFDETPRDRFSPEAEYKEFDEWSSLIALSIIAMVDDEYGVALKGDDIKNARTIKDIFDIVTTQKK